MPWPVLPDLPEPIKDPKEKPKQAAPDVLSFFEKLLTLIITWQYFHFTGKAIANGKKLPKDWLRLRDRILPKKLKEVLEETPKEKKPSSFKVVDLQTKEPIKIQ